jgi:hypothetical protein
VEKVEFKVVSLRQSRPANEAQNSRRPSKKASWFFETTRTASEKHTAEIKRLNALLALGAVDETYARAASNSRMH